MNFVYSIDVEYALFVVSVASVEFSGLACIALRKTVQAQLIRLASQNMYMSSLFPQLVHQVKSLEIEKFLYFFFFSAPISKQFPGSILLLAKFCVFFRFSCCLHDIENVCVYKLMRFNQID